MTKSSLASWLSYLEQLHPKAIDLGLERIANVADRLMLQVRPPTTLTVAGTNGKGSCVAVMDAALRAAGHRVGVYTSPHLVHFNERIVIDGRPVSDQSICDAFDAIDTARGNITLSYFEFATLAALWLFRKAGVDMQILEVGLGGRLDGVNILDADVAVVTSIGLDHTDWLGDTRELIAIEKAGIARSGKPVVVADADIPSTLLPELKRIGARVIQLDRDWTITGATLRHGPAFEMTLPAPSGLLDRNIAAALIALDAIGIDISSPLINDAINRLTLAGRRQHIDFNDVDVLLDVAHNRESVAILIAALVAKPVSGRTLAVFAAMADKPIHDILGACSLYVDVWFLPDFAEHQRVAKSSDLVEELRGSSVQCYVDFDAAWSAVWSVAAQGDRILVFGSFVTVGAAVDRMRRTKYSAT